MSEQEETGSEDWAPLGPYRWVTPLTAVATTSGFFVGYFAFEVGWSVARVMDLEPPIVYGALLGLLAMVAAVGIAVLVQLRRFPRPYVDSAMTKIRTGDRVVEVGDLDRAQLVSDLTVYGEWTRASLVVSGAGARLVFPIRTSRGTMSERDAGMVRTVLERSSIEMPSSADDPTGRFARINFPGSLSRDDAVSLVSDPPEQGAKLPVVL